MLGRIDLAESLAQMRAGELAPARTRGEQLGEPADQSPEPPDNVTAMAGLAPEAATGGSRFEKASGS